MNQPELNWTQEQVNVIEAPCNLRMLLDAGPGTGKTATLCARIAWLIDNSDINPNTIWVISFTRTAVNELRNRISSYLKDPAQVFAIRIATIDAYAWSIQSGFLGSAALTGTFDQNIKSVIDLIKENQGVFEYIASASHLFVDEAQDVVGPRVELVLELINAMPANAGVTILADSAQGIYEFARDDNSDSMSGSLPDNVLKYMPNFEIKELKEIHRTEDPILINLYSSGRECLRSEATPLKKFNQVKKIITESNHGVSKTFSEDVETLDLSDKDAFFLFRSRGDAIKAACEIKDAPFRLRIAGLPNVIHSWIGIIFWDWFENEISADDFKDRWSKRIPQDSRFSHDSCWQILIRNFGKSSNYVDIRVMNQRLSGISPPIECCDMEYGFAGPILGTIHAAKGREANSVRLYLPSPQDSWASKFSNNYEEAKVLFVGASRAKQKLYVGSSPKVSSRNLQGGRAYTEDLLVQSKVNMEVGHLNDVEADGLVGQKLFKTLQEAKQAQKRLESIANRRSSAKVFIHNTNYFDYPIYSDSFDDAPICYLSQRFKWDMKKMAKQFHCKYYKGMTKGVTILGARTLAISDQDLLRPRLWEPWKTSGFMLAPILIGYPKINFSFNPV